VFLGAYILQNLATGVMVSNYQLIRQRMDEQRAKMDEIAQQHNNVDELVQKVWFGLLLFKHKQALALAEPGAEAVEGHTHFSPSLPLLLPPIKGKKVKVVNLYSASTRSVSKALRYSTHCQGITQFYLHTLHFICNRNEPYLPLASQSRLVLIYRPRRDERLSRP